VKLWRIFMKQYTVFQKKVNRFVMNVTMNKLHRGLIAKRTPRTLWRLGSAKQVYSEEHDKRAAILQKRSHGKVRCLAMSRWDTAADESDFRTAQAGNLTSTGRNTRTLKESVIPCVTVG